MHRARDRVENEEWVEKIDTAADTLGIDTETQGIARDIFLNNMPEEDRSKPAVIATSLYVATLIAGDERSQTEVADVVGVSRLTIQQRWQALLENVGMETPQW